MANQKPVLEYRPPGSDPRFSRERLDRIDRLMVKFAVGIILVIVVCAIVFSLI